jgi:glycosyltransferase involved in cell wall biosynthesis
MLSFIVPAHDEELLIAATLRAIRLAAGPSGRLYELIVVDDASTDRTAAIAATEGARVVSVDARHIARARNAGAAAATGDMLVFVDADTLVTPEVVAATIEAIDAGADGGGAAVRLDAASQLYAKALMRLSTLGGRWLRWASGCYVFCTRQAFVRAGGFDERLYAGEEIALSRTFKRHGRFVMLREYVVTSGRKLRTHSLRELVWTLTRITLGGRRALESRARLELWYGPRRPDI